MAKAKAVVTVDRKLLTLLESLPARRTNRRCYICTLPDGVREAVRIARTKPISLGAIAETLRANGYEHTTRAKLEYHNRNCR